MVNLNEIKKFKWVISPTLQVTKLRIESITSVEQEIIINAVKVGYNNKNEEEIKVDCSYQRYITKLSKSEYFNLEGISISEKTGLILSVKGYLDIKGLSIRKVKKILSEEVKKKISDALKKGRNK